MIWQSEGSGSGDKRNGESTIGCIQGYVCVGKLVLNRNAESLWGLVRNRWTEKPKFVIKKVGREME